MPLLPSPPVPKSMGRTLSFKQLATIFSLHFLLEYLKYSQSNHRPRRFDMIQKNTSESPKPKSINTIMENRTLTAKIECPREHFNDTLLIIALPTYHAYESIPLYELLYGGGFSRRVLCGPSLLSNDSSMLVINTRNGAFLYDCLSQAVIRYPNFTGYLFVAEEVLLNYWNFMTYDRNKIWQDADVVSGPALYSGTPDNWEWWASPWGMRAIEKAFEYLVERNYGDIRKSKLSEGDWKPEWDINNALNAWLWNGGGQYKAFWVDKSILYLPKRHLTAYSKLAKIFRQSGVRHALAMPTIMRLLESEDNSLKLYGVAMNHINGSQNREYLSDASKSKDFIYITGGIKERRKSLNDLKIKEYAMGKFLYYDTCPVHT